MASYMWPTPKPNDLAAPLVLPAESGKPLTTQGGNTLDDGSGNVQLVSLHTLVQGPESEGIGQNALASATPSAGYNTALGFDALTADTDGQDNTAIGWGALAGNTTANFSTAVGLGALQHSNSDYNVAVGAGAATNLTTGSQNTVVGFNALQTATTTGNNVAVGFAALQSATGGGNTAVGSGANQTSAAVSNSTAIGAATVASGAGSVAIGTDGAGTGALATSDNEFVLGTASHNVKVPGDLQLSGAATFSSGTGAPTIAGTAGDYFFRTDTPTVADQRIYVCTVTGAAGSATWVGIV